MTAIGQEKIHFELNGGISAKVEVDSQNIFISIKEKNDVIFQKIVTDIQKKITLHSEDYNFDGFDDFSFSYFDEGQGTFFISRVFLYSPSDKGFYEIHPACGDEFINLKVDKKSKTLISVFFKENSPRLCKTKF